MKQDTCDRPFQWRVVLVSVAVALTATVSVSPLAAQRVDWRRLLDSTPGWPVVNHGAAIPDSLINEWRSKAYQCPDLASGGKDWFPAKAKAAKDANGKDIKICDDGDATLFNGLLCISGDEKGCEAVRQSQSTEGMHHGQWYRSPNRRHYASTECSKGPGTTADTERFYCQECVNAFSPDMALGTALWLFKSNDMGAFKRWSAWMDKNAQTTTVQWKGAKPQRFPWPRLCDLDTACTVQGKVVKGPESMGLPISSGACFLLPNHAPDFEYLDRKLEPDWGPTTRKALAHSRQVKATLLMAASAVTGAPIGSPALDLLVAEKGKGYSAHLDAVRVLLREVAKNPELKFETLPPMPTFTSAFAGSFDIGANEDPVINHNIATRIYSNQKWNSFYRLIAEGPTTKVREQILANCPKSGEQSGTQDVWLWNTNNENSPGSRASMGWDCVFVAGLYNKMRVPKNFVDELFQKFDPVNRLLQDAAALASKARTELAQAKALMDSADAALMTAKRIVESHTEQARADLVDALSVQTSAVANAHNQVASAVDRLNSVAPCPGDFDPIGRRTCRALKDRLRSDIAAANRVHAAAAAAANGATQRIAAFDRDLQTARGGLENGALEVDARFRNNQYESLGAVLKAAEKKLTDTRRTYGRATAQLGLWSGEGEGR